MSGIKEIIADVTGLSPDALLISLGICLYFLYDHLGIVRNIIITSFVLAIFDIYLKNIILLGLKDDYHVFIVNNTITIITIDILITAVNNKDSPHFTFSNYINIAFACLFYETIVFKLYNYNKLCNKRLRTITKTIMRLATVHIL